MPIKQVTSDQLTRQGVCGVIYGKPGVGKTTLLAQLADLPIIGAPVRILDVEGGASVMSHRNDIIVDSITDIDEKTGKPGYGWKDLDDEVDKIVMGKSRMPDGSDIGTIIVDNLTEGRNLAKEHVVRTVSRGENIKMVDRPDQNDWSKINTELLVLVRKLRDFSRVSGTNVIFIVQEKAEQDKDGNVLVRHALNLNPALMHDLPGLVDFVGILRIKNKGIRELSFAVQSSTQAKFRRNWAEVAKTIPEVFRYDLMQKGCTPFQDIVETLRTGKPFPTGKYKSGSTDEASSD